MEIGNLAQWAAVVMSAIVAILAVWGDKFRTWLAGPQLELALRPSGLSLRHRYHAGILLRTSEYFHWNGLAAF
jgi:hypothetical protein